MRHLATKTFVVALLAVFGSLTSKAQFVVTDPTNYVGNITNVGLQLKQAADEFQVLQSQLKEVQRVYDAVDNTLKVYTGVQEAWTAVSDLQYITQSTVRKLQADSYLTTAEKIAVIRGCGKLIKIATNEVNQMAVAQNVSSEDSGNGLGFGNGAERIAYLENIKNKIIEYRNLADYYTSQYAMMSKVRRTRNATQLKFDMLTGADRRR